MAEDHFATLGFEARKQFQQSFPKLLFYSVALILSHVIHLKPSEIDAGGIKIEIKDLVIIHGGICLFLMYYFWSVSNALIESSSSLQLYELRRFSRYWIRRAQIPYVKTGEKRHSIRSIKQIKNYARRRMIGFTLFNLPYFIMVFSIVIFALLMAVRDLIEFLYYIFEQASASEFLIFK